MLTEGLIRELVIASGNKGKLRELQAALAPLGWAVESQSSFLVPDIEETGMTFVENAILKARNACQHSGRPSLADDSGLEVDALNGAPGIYSARYAGPAASDAANNMKLLAEMSGVSWADRSARFYCVLVFMRHAQDPAPLICQAAWEGLILEQTRGEGGFGYDPLFYLPDLQCTSAELPAETKNRLSHRGQATAKLVTSLSQV